MFTKKLRQDDLDEMVFYLDMPFDEEDTKDVAETVYLHYENNANTKKLIQQTAQTFKATHTPHEKLKQELRTKLEEHYCNGEFNNTKLPHFYILLMLITHKNFQALLTALSRLKFGDAPQLFTLKIFFLTVQQHYRDIKSTDYTICSNFLNQLVELKMLDKVGCLYKFSNDKWEFDDQEYALKVIKELPERYKERLKELLGIDKTTEEALEALDDIHS